MNPAQKGLYRLAPGQIEHNTEILRAGMSLAEQNSTVSQQPVRARRNDHCFCGVPGRLASMAS